MNLNSPRTWMSIAWIQAVIAMSASLYFSEIVGWEPCELCWYQRILMYPLVLILGLALWRNEKQIAYYVLPMSIIGGLIAAYHYLLQWGIFQESSCSATAVSCAYVPEMWFGFVTLPLLSLLAFTLITFCMLKMIRGSQ